MPTTRKREEADLQSAVIEHVQRLRPLRVAHFRQVQIRPGRWVTPVQGDGAGWPDLVIAGPGGQLYRELKSRTGKVDPDQQVWMDLLTAGGADVAVWRPADLISGRITRELQAIRRPRPVAAACTRIDQAMTDAAVFRAALEQIRDAQPDTASTAALLASFRHLADEVLAGKHHPIHDHTKEAIHG